MNKVFAPPKGLVKKLEMADKLVLTGHIDPDPDCIGAVLALKFTLEQMGKKAYAVIPTITSPGLHLIPEVKEFLRPADLDRLDWDVFVVLDCEPKRTGKLLWPYLEKSAVVINIDHHPTNVNVDPINWIEPSFAATTQMVYQLVKTLKVDLTPSIANLIYLGLAGDTGSFRFSNTSSDVLRIAAELVDLGVEPYKISKILYQSHSFIYLNQLSQILSRAELLADGKVICAALPQELNTTPTLTVDGVIQYLLMVEGIEVAIFIQEIEPNKIKVQLRSKGEIDVSIIALDLGGGGHKQASGCQLTCSLEEAKSRVIQRIIAEL